MAKVSLPLTDINQEPKLGSGSAQLSTLKLADGESLILIDKTEKRTDQGSASAHANGTG